ncbi:arginine deiminase [Frankia sp. BMG5.23]|nr:arginine deiminase [Frankia sp. BMG5.23]
MKLRGRLGRETTYVVADGAGARLRAGRGGPREMTCSGSDSGASPLERTADGGWYATDMPEIVFYDD